ncbi:germination protein YpeB [Mesobacillus harenae]|uniref:germination protein YpeB n=1 Tax=Mesobacillus harenae TaxID=2213203 RepID=UPI00157FC7E0
MIRNIIIGILVIGVAGTAYWGYQEHREKTAVLIHAENSYQRAFHDLTFQVDLLHDKIGTTLAMNSQKSLSPALADVWKITSEAHNDVGQLPLTLLPFNKTEQFLANVGNFSHKAALRDLTAEPLSDKEYQTLKALYTQSQDIQNELRQVQHLVFKNNLRWMDVELALAAGDEKADNTIIDGFKTVEKTVEGYSETEFGVANLNMQKKDENFKYLEGEKITKREAVNIAKKYAGLGEDSEVKVTENGKGSDYGFFSVTLKNSNDITASMDITKKGGQPIWYLLSRDVEKQVISLNDASNKAISFLKENGFENLDMFESAQYDNVGVFTFVTNENDIRIYPDAIKVKVALDNGNIIGVSASDYLKSHHTREIPEPAITAEEARGEVNPNLQVMEQRQAIIMNELKEEVLCHEILGTLGDDTYRIFINAENGIEEKVEKLKQAEQVYEDVV